MPVPPHPRHEAIAAPTHGRTVADSGGAMGGAKNVLFLQPRARHFPSGPVVGFSAPACEGPAVPLFSATLPYYSHPFLQRTHRIVVTLFLYS